MIRTKTVRKFILSWKISLTTVDVTIPELSEKN